MAFMAHIAMGGPSPGSGAQRRQASIERDPHIADGGKGLVFPLSSLFEDQLVQRQVGNGFAKSTVLAFQSFKPASLDRASTPPYARRHR